MEQDVEVKDRVLDVEYLRLALAMVGFHVSYIQADLINDAVYAIKKKRGKFSAKDSIDILYAWKNKWKEYFEKNETI